MKTRIWFVLLMVPVFFTGCVKPEKKILGTWKLDTMENFYFTFMENEELSVNDEIFMKYNFTSDNKLVLGQEEPVSFTIKGNTMYIHQEGLNITLTKVKRFEKRR
jgi:hypothetical protein